jgi:hypothetical protein
MYDVSIALEYWLEIYLMSNYSFSEFVQGKWLYAQERGIRLI